MQSVVIVDVAYFCPVPLPFVPFALLHDRNVALKRSPARNSNQLGRSKCVTWFAGGYGVRVQMSAKVRCFQCKARENKGSGYLAHTFASLEITDCSSDKDRYGGCILESSTFKAKNFSVRHAVYDGFEIRSRCAIPARAYRCQIFTTRMQPVACSDGLSHYYFGAALL
jgi:hypothetical protein